MLFTRLNESLINENIDNKKPYIIKDLEKHNITDQKEQQQIINYLKQADPISNKSNGKKTPYVNLILKWLLTNKIRLPEDIETVSNVLVKAHELVNNKGAKLIINDYNSPGDLRKDVNELLGVVDKGEYDYLKLVGEISGFRLYRVDSWDDGERAFKDSGWCVQQRIHFDRYKPPYFMVVTDGDKRYALMHKDSYQLKDVHDESLSLKLAKPIEKFVKMVWPEPKFIGDLMDIIDLWPNAIEVIKKDPESAYHYARYVIKGKWSEGEEVISKDPKSAYEYARYIIDDRWPKAEEVISKDPKSACYYAHYVINGRWPKGEEAIKKDPVSAYEYARYVIKNRWPEAEEVISKDPRSACGYAFCVIKGRWPEVEDIISKDAWSSAIYAMHIIEGRWPKAEEVISKDPRSACLYVYEIIKGRWPKGEEAINSDPEIATLYKKYLETGERRGL